MNIYEFDIPLSEEDIYNFTSESTVYSNEKNKLYIAVHADEGRNFETDPYIKVSWQSNFSKNDKVARLSLTTGNYVVHNGMSVSVPNKIAKQVNKVLASKCTDNSVTKDIKDTINDELNTRDDLSKKQKEEISKQDITYMDAVLYDAYQKLNDTNSYLDYRDDIKGKFKEFKNLTDPKKTTINKWGR